MVHVYHQDEPDGLHVRTCRVTVIDGAKFNIEGRALILGTLPRIDYLIPLATVEHFWIEED